MEKKNRGIFVIAGKDTDLRKAVCNSTPRQLSVIVNQINNYARSWLQTRAEEVLAQVDDSLFAMAEKAHLQAEQDGLFQAIRLLRVEQSRVLGSFCDGIENCFHSPQRDLDTDDPRSANLPPNNLSLVHNDDLEQQVVIRTMVANIKRDQAEAIAELSLRLDTLMPFKIFDENLPLGPRSICHAFTGALAPLEIHLRARITILKKFEQHLINRLGELYEGCNSLLIESGVLPDLKDPLRQAAASATRTPGPDVAGSKPASPAEAFSGYMPDSASNAASSKVTGQMHAGVALEAAVPGAEIPGFIPGAAGMLGGMDAGMSPAGMPSGKYAPGLMPPGSGAAPMATPSLLHYLGQLQVSLPSLPMAAGQLLDVNQLLQQRLIDSKQSASLQELDSEVIRLVDMLFSFMLEDRNLAEPVKVQLIRLQLPMLKLAVADKAFFSKSGHPARKLLNELADAAIGWQPGENYLNDPLYREVCTNVEAVLAEFDQDENVFARLLDSFRAFSTRERKRAEVMERRTVDEAQGTARVEAAKARVAAVFDALTAERKLPRIVHEWLNRVWSSVLFRACLKEGTESGVWRQHVLTARDLIWSVVAPMPESSVKMQRLLPGLRKRLDDGAVSLSLSSGDRQRLLNGLDVLYRESQALAERVESERERRTRERLVQELRREADSVVAIPDSHIDEPDLPEDQPALPNVEQLQKVVTEVKLNRSIGLSSLPKGDSFWLQTYHLKDSWFLQRNPEKLPVRCRLAAIISDIDQFMFVNRQGSKVGVYSRLELAHALRNGELLPLEQGPLFERALEHVVGSIGESKIAISV